MDRAARVGSSTAAVIARSRIAATYPPLGPRITHHLRSMRAVNRSALTRFTAVSLSKDVTSGVLAGRRRLLLGRYRLHDALGIDPHRHGCALGDGGTRGGALLPCLARSLGRVR